jgi:hypothetical protein
VKSVGKGEDGDDEDEDEESAEFGFSNVTVAWGGSVKPPAGRATEAVSDVQSTTVDESDGAP